MAEVGICLATYNGEKYIVEQLESLVAQTHGDFHCYIQDDGSTDKTVEKLIDFISNREKQNDYRFQIVSIGKRQGVRENFLSLLRETKENYVMFCDQDDVWLPNKIEVSLIALKNMELQYGKETPLMVFTDLLVVDADLNIIKETVYASGLNPHERDWKKLIRKNNNFGNTEILNRELANIVNGIKGPLPSLSIHDNLITCIASVVGEIGYLEKSTILYRQHGNNTIGVSNKKISILSKILKTLKLILTKDERWGCQSVKEFCEVFAQLKNLKIDDKKIIDEVLQLGKRNKFYRMKFYKKHGFYHGIRLLWA